MLIFLFPYCRAPCPCLRKLFFGAGWAVRLWRKLFCRNTLWTKEKGRFLPPGQPLLYGSRPKSFRHQQRTTELRTWKYARRQGTRARAV